MLQIMTIAFRIPMLNLTDTKISKALKSYQIQKEGRFDGLFSDEAYQNLRPAAVMIPLIEHENRWYLLLTRRAEHLMEHRDQVAFPGGAMERGDGDLLSTALREMKEEIGVVPHAVTIFGDLGEMPVITGYLVRLFVGKIPWPYELKINRDEVKDVFIVPLEWLADPNHRTLKFRSYAGREFPVIFFDDYEGQQLWGASAEMTLNLLTALELI
jgi:8-oxo-dGTP pyrophosphatase MutT (NUDIX family)